MSRKAKKPKRIVRRRDSRGRTRGGASVPCPARGCGRDTRVVRTTRSEGGVCRERRCPRGHRHHTRETPT